MMKFAANLSMLFHEVPFLDRFEAASRAGFHGVEYLFPYAYQPGDLVGRLQRHKLKQVLFNMPPGDWDAGERGIACLPDRTAEFAASIEQALDYAKQLNCTQVHCMAGIAPRGADVSALRKTYIPNIQRAADTFAATDILLLIEPINTQDIPGYFLNRSDQALDLIAAINRPNVRLQYDCYHMHIMEGRLLETLERNLSSIAHVQIADAPGRHEPGTGDIDYAAVFTHLERIGYDKWIGCEYRPQGETLAGLKWRGQLSG